MKGARRGAAALTACVRHSSQELCVMEAMKMQNVLRAIKDGVVKRVVAKVRIYIIYYI